MAIHSVSVQHGARDEPARLPIVSVSCVRLSKYAMFNSLISRSKLSMYLGNSMQRREGRMHGLLNHLKRHREMVAHSVPVREMGLINESHPNRNDAQGASRAVTKLRSPDVDLTLPDPSQRGEGRADILLDSPVAAWTVNQADIVAPVRAHHLPSTVPLAASSRLHKNGGGTQLVLAGTPYVVLLVCKNVCWGS
jgi:hypothetical protein